MDESVKAMQEGIEKDSGITASEAASEARDMAAGDAQCEAAAEDAYRAKNAHLCKTPDVTPAETEELLKPNA